MIQRPFGRCGQGAIPMSGSGRLEKAISEIFANSTFVFDALFTFASVTSGHRSL
jgi:hypothetical protein